MQVPSGFISCVTLQLPDQQSVTIESQPFLHTEKRTSTRRCDECAICSQAGADACMEVGVTVAFEPMSAVSAGVRTVQPFQPPPWSRTYRIPLHQKCDESDDVVVTLIRVDYNELYVPPKDEA